jgi:hypothetical protein
MGNKGAVVIRKFKGNVEEEDVDNVMKELQMYFTITADKGFKCYLMDEMIPTEDIDTVVSIPSKCSLEDIPNLLDKLAESSRSLINGKIDVKGCEVEGYVFYVGGIPYAIINKRWKALKEKYLEKYTELAELYGIYKKSEHPIGYDEINRWVKKCEDFLTDKEIPKGVRYTKGDRITNMLNALCYANGTNVGDYLRFHNRLDVNRFRYPERSSLQRISTIPASILIPDYRVDLAAAPPRQAKIRKVLPDGPCLYPGRTQNFLPGQRQFR